MWQLVIILLINLFPLNSDIYIIIVDECSKWKKINHTWKMEDKLSNEKMFTYEKDVMDLPFVSISRTWLKDKDKLDTKRLTLKEIKKSNLFLTSEFSAKDWIEFVDKIKDQKIYLVTPEEYCSEKRFAFQSEFTLYEVQISIPIKE